MNIKNLKKRIEKNGSEFKNYRELCNTLEITPKGGNQKKAQLKEMESYLKLSKGKGYSLIIDEVYDTPKLIKKGNSVYSELTQILLTDFFMKTNVDRLHVSKSYLMQQVNMINRNYIDNKKDVDSYSEITNIDKNVIYDFYDTTDATLGVAIESALKKLESRAIILYTTDYIVQEEVSEKYRSATPQERQIILQTRDKLLKKHGYKTIREILFSNKQNIFKRENGKIIKDKLNLTGVFSGYNIDILQESIAEKQSNMIYKLLSNTESEGYKGKLNNIVVQRLLENAERRHKKVKGDIKVGFGEKWVNEKDKARYSNNYIKEIKVIVEDNIKR